MPTPNEQDLIRVRNIAVNDHTIESDIVQVPRTLKDIEGNETGVYYENIEQEWDNSKGFRVKWGGKPHVIRPGETKVYPRFLAEHYASKLADHMMMVTGKNLKDKISRRKFMDKIMVEVVSFYEDDDRDEGEIVFDRVEEVNRTAPKREAGDIDIGKDLTEHFMGRRRVEDFDDFEESEDEMGEASEIVDLSKQENADLHGKVTE